MEKTNTSKSPLLKPVIERDYTKGINLSDPSPSPTATATPQAGSQQAEMPKPGAATPPPPPGTGPKFNIPDDTKEFSFDEISDDASDVNAGDSSEGINISSASAKTFANFVGDAIQMYLPKVTYGYCKIDLENVIVNIEKGTLTPNWLDAFTHINENTEESLKISDDAIKMWKKAFKEYLEYKQIKIANPETAFWVATLVLATTQGIKIRELNKNNKQYIVDAINSWNPDYFESFRAKVDEAESKKEDKTEKETKEVKDSKTSKKTL